MIQFLPLVQVPVPTSASAMKVATTVFVGNISEKASDTLIRQILLVRINIHVYIVVVLVMPSHVSLSLSLSLYLHLAMWSSRRMEESSGCQREAARYDALLVSQQREQFLCVIMI